MKTLLTTVALSILIFFMLMAYSDKVLPADYRQGVDSTPLNEQIANEVRRQQFFQEEVRRNNLPFTLPQVQRIAPTLPSNTYDDGGYDDAYYGYDYGYDD